MILQVVNHPQFMTHYTVRWLESHATGEDMSPRCHAARGSAFSLPGRTAIDSVRSLGRARLAMQQHGEPVPRAARGINLRTWSLAFARCSPRSRKL